MKLETYLIEEGLTQAAFASRLGVPSGTIHRYIRNIRKPSKNMLSRIFDATNGKVTPNDFYGIKESSTQPAA